MAASSPGAASNGTPNGAQKGPGVGVAAYKAAATAAVKEYFDSCDAGEVARQLLELGEPGLGPLAVKIAVVLALDRKDRERELMQVLLTELHPRVIDNEQMAEGFTRLLKSADDLVLDIPDAVHLLALTTARAIVDEVLPPVFLESVLPTLPAGGLGVEVVKAAGSMLSQRHAAERLQMCWRGGGLTVEAMRREMKTAVQDYLNSKNVDEVAQVFAEMNIPSYGHELVKVSLEAAFAQPSAAGAVGDLLRGLAGMNTLNGTQLAKGLSRVQAQLPDEALDAPGAPDIFAGIIDRARKEGWLPAEYAAYPGGPLQRASMAPGAVGGCFV